MKTLKNQTLLYDQDCPLCNVYTSAFIKTKMLDNNGRKSYCELSDNEQTIVNMKKAANEIALVDFKNKTVIYGIDSLLKVIGYSFPIVEKIGNIKPINTLLKKLYSFISYNRKVIIPSSHKNDKELQCIPDFNFKYRWIYILFTMILSIYLLNNFVDFFKNFSKLSINTMFILFVGQVFIQCILISFKNKKTIVNYLGNLMTIILFGSFLTLPLAMLMNTFNVSQNFILIYFSLVVFFMFIEHYRRIKLLQLPHYLTFSWIFYRILILIYIL